MADADRLTAVLHGAGYRVTAPRQVVWEVLADAAGHLTADEIAARVQQRRPGVNLASIYRALALLEELDLARESRLGESDAARWELAHPDEHFHLVCRACGAVEHHAGPAVGEIRSHLHHSHGFEAESVELVVTGRCPSCARDGGAPR